ncbi:MAG: endolytic transglycosylase MltG [Lachnospiraceae bacterium]|nr:endolytic transglycosylase MltG [Lachnospiraceae bacterium]MBO7633352.1 endolytic transglycosylase MltG [Lachnospiraceae bacterium]MBP5652609.1 endolytic transglycosylase MltG [Lachnospiraceae bacterium]
MAKSKTSSGSNKAVRILLNFALGILTIGIAVIFYAVVVYGIKKAAGYSYDFAYQLFGDTSVEAAPGRDVKITILKGESSMNIASKLEDAKLVTSKYSFYLKLKMKDYEIMPGTFELNTSMTYDDILQVITDYGQSIDAETTVEDVESTP